MKGRPYHRRYHSDALTGYMALSLEERGAYSTILDMLYDCGEPIQDNERYLAGCMACSIRKYRSVRDSLIEKGKIFVTENGRISNSRFEKEAENDAKFSRKQAENRSKQTRNETENEKNLNENKGADEPSINPRARSTSTSTSKERKKEEDIPEQKKYGFEQGVIRLTEADLAKWADAFPDLSVKGELVGLADWASTQKNWFVAVSGALAKRQREAKDRRMAEKANAGKPDERQRWSPSGGSMAI